MYYSVHLVFILINKIFVNNAKVIVFNAIAVFAYNVNKIIICIMEIVIFVILENICYFQMQLVNPFVQTGILVIVVINFANYVIKIV